MHKLAFLNDYGYSHDIFVSYSQGDVSGNGLSPLCRWSRQMAQLLEKTVETILRKPVSIFMDTDPRDEAGVDPLDHLSNQLPQAIRRSALLKVLMSPHYLDSNWCKLELNWWTESEKSKLGRPCRRIAICHVMRTSSNEWPSLLKDSNGVPLIGFRFHDPEEDLPWGFLTNFNSGAPNDKFAESMIKLAGHLTKRLRDLHDELSLRAKQEEHVNRLKEGSRLTAYLHARAVHQNYWERVRLKLKEAAFDVRPGEPEPDEVYENERVQRDLSQISSQCDALLLLGVNGFELDSDLELIGFERRSYIRSRYRKHLPCAVLDCGGIGTEARRDVAKSHGIEWISYGDNAWPQNFRAWLKRAGEHAEQIYGLGE